MGTRIGLYGGTFDPIHHGHLISARALAEQLELTRVILIPSAKPPHKPDVAHTPIADRIAMVRAAVEGDALFEVSTIEADRDGPSFTFDTVSAFREQLGEGAELFWFIGGDSLPELKTWHRIRELVERVTIVTAARPGWKLPSEAELTEAVGPVAARRLLDHCIATPKIGISATQIRSRCAEGRSIRYLAPEAVVEYVTSHALYRSRR